MLTDLEAVFRSLKSALGLRPIGRRGWRYLKDTTGRKRPWCHPDSHSTSIRQLRTQLPLRCVEIYEVYRGEQIKYATGQSCVQ
jgi:hypothetical protein